MAFLGHAGPQPRAAPADHSWYRAPQRTGLKRAGRWLSSTRLRQPAFSPASVYLSPQLAAAAPAELPGELRLFTTGPAAQPRVTEASSVQDRVRLVDASDDAGLGIVRRLTTSGIYPKLSDDSGIQPGRLDVLAGEMPLELRQFLVTPRPQPLVSDDTLMHGVQIPDAVAGLPVELRRCLLVSDRQLRQADKQSVVLKLHRGLGRKFAGRFLVSAVRQRVRPSISFVMPIPLPLPAAPPSAVELQRFFVPSERRARPLTISYTMPRQSDIGRRAGSFWKTPDRQRTQRPAESVLRGLQLLPFIPPIPMPVELQRFLTVAARQPVRPTLSSVLAPQVIVTVVALPEELRRWVAGTEKTVLRVSAWSPETVFLRPQIVLPPELPLELRRFVVTSDRSMLGAISWRPEIGWLAPQIPTTSEPPIELRRWRFTPDPYRQWHRAWMPEVGWVRLQIPDKPPTPSELFKFMQTPAPFRRGPHVFEDAWFGDRFAIDEFVITRACGLIRFRWGTHTKWGTGWVWGFGVSDPYTACGDPPTRPRFDVELCDDTTPTLTGEISSDTNPTKEDDPPTTYTKEGDCT